MADLNKFPWGEIIKRIPTEGLIILAFFWIGVDYLKELHKAKSILCFTVEITLYGFLISGILITIATIFKPKKTQIRTHTHKKRVAKAMIDKSPL
jgi:hypothetical protein